MSEGGHPYTVVSPARPERFSSSRHHEQSRKRLHTPPPPLQPPTATKTTTNTSSFIPEAQHHLTCMSHICITCFPSYCSSSTIAGATLGDVARRPPATPSPGLRSKTPTEARTEAECASPYVCSRSRLVSAGRLSSFLRRSSRLSPVSSRCVFCWGKRC